MKKLCVIVEATTTPQTLALGCLTGINDTQMGKLWYYLRNVGNTESKLQKSEMNRIDKAFGLDAMMPSATFGSFALEWAATNGTGVEKKPLEQCNFWNADILVEVAAEIDLIHHSAFLENPDMRTFSPLGYRAPGFADKPGIVVLFGGDHGAGACPCSVKLNFSSPQARKERGQLNCRCPATQIASIDCTKDSFELLQHHHAAHQAAVNSIAKWQRVCRLQHHGSMQMPEILFVPQVFESLVICHSGEGAFSLARRSA